MKLNIFTAIAILLTGIPAVFAQSSQSVDVPVGVISYSLPMTSLSFEVEARQENFYAGPYAKFASKYLGIDVRQKDAVSYQLTDVKMTPAVEADYNCRYVLDAGGAASAATLLSLTSQGLVSSGNDSFGREQAWRFPVAVSGDFSERGVSSNFTTESATLYTKVKKESAYDKVAVKQNMVVEKSLEKKAAEAADMIFALREKRLQIITGDTDATYSGEAMGAAVSELSRLENEYMTLFTGYSEYQTQKTKFDLVPEKGRDSQMYIAFRISDVAGLLPADNLSGKPVVLEIIPQVITVPELSKKEAKAAAKLPVVNYRIPAICTVKLINGAEEILRTRIPIYQLGVDAAMPVTMKYNK